MKITAQPFWSYWGLSRNPFGNIESANDVFSGREMDRVTGHLTEAIEEGGIFSVVGERGIGKTTVKNELINYFEENSSRYAYAVLESMDLRQVTMSVINAALIADLSSEAPKQGAEHRGRQVVRIIGELAARKRVILVIDEAQMLPLDTLEKLKMLTERRWAFRSRLITVVLFGQPELTHKLSRDEGLNLRVTQYRLAGLVPDEVAQYIDLRCRCAGISAQDVFAPEALMYIAENQHSPLHINHVCATCMRIARQTGEKKITLAMVYECGGIRSPRQIIRDNNISVKALAEMLQMPERVTASLVGGDTHLASPEQQERFRSGLRNMATGAPVVESVRREKAAG